MPEGVDIEGRIMLAQIQDRVKPLEKIGVAGKMRNESVGFEKRAGKGDTPGGRTEDHRGVLAFCVRGRFGMLGDHPIQDNVSQIRGCHGAVQRELGLDSLVGKRDFQITLCESMEIVPWIGILQSALESEEDPPGCRGLEDLHIARYRAGFLDH